jgi:MHS family alpha-ketoglutarate permease-like MFS transporter
MSNMFGPASFTFYVMLLLVISALTVRSLPETRGRVLTDRPADFRSAQ